ncbi:MAG TPA: segregation/condensation protein A [Bacilli bacterium]|nr:segregation/condensation protein A [Bacilli bacterium]
MNYQFKINDFEGPLDLLLHLIKENKMDIYEIDIAVIVDEYLTYIHQMKDINIDLASEYLVMASELVHLKSRMLLNETTEDDNEEYELNTEEDLRNKLLEYQKYQSLKTEFRSLEEKRSEVLTKLPENLNEYQEKEIYNNNQSIEVLLNAFQSFLDRQEYQKPLTKTITKKEYSVEERIKVIRNIFKTKKKVKFYDLFDIINKDYLIVTFLSILEMTKNNELLINQDNNFGDIYLEVQ